MSKMADLYYDIQELYIDGVSARNIARILDCPMETVLAVLQDMSVVDEPQEDEYDPYGTMNS